MIASSSQTYDAIFHLNDLKTLINNASDYSDQIILIDGGTIQTEQKDISKEQKIEDQTQKVKNQEESSNDDSISTKEKEIQTKRSNLLDLSGEELEIKSSLNLTFTSDCVIKCKHIKITNSQVHFSFLNLIGSIFIENSVLKMENSEVHDPPSIEGGNTDDYLVNCNKNSQFIAENSKFYNSPNFGLCADEGCLIFLNFCLVQNIRLFGIAVTCFSNFYSRNCQFYDIKNEHVFLDNDSNATCIECLFDKSDRRAFNASNKSSVTIETCEIKNCKEGALLAAHCDKILVVGTHIHDLDYSAIYLDQTMAIIKRSTIEKCNGNGVNIAHRSKAIITQCLFNNTIYPAVAICEKSFSLVQRCEIKDSQMSGLIVRFGSKAKIENCLISDSKTFGICISDSKGVGIIKTLINGSGEAAVNAYNHSNVFIKDSYILGPSKQGFNVFCGAVVSSVNTVIIGMQETAAWIHHAGSGCFLKTIVSFKPVQPHDDILLSIDEICDLSEETEDINDESSLIGKNELLDIKPQSINPKIDKFVNDPFDEHNLTSNNELEKLVKIETLRPVVFQRERGSKGEQLITKNPTSDLPKYGLGHTHPTCKLCGKDSSDCFFFLCGHSVYCKACWEGLGENKPKICELCHMNIESTVTPIDCSASENFSDETPTDKPIKGQMCSICYEAEVDTLIVPCGHTICHKCASHWYDINVECPFCRNCSRAKRFVSYK